MHPHVAIQHLYKTSQACGKFFKEALSLKGSVCYSKMPSTFRHSLSHVQIRQIRSGIAGLKKTQGNPHAWVRSSSGPNLGKNEHFFSDVSLLSRKSFFSVYSYDFSFVRILTYFIYKDVDTNLPSIQHLYVHLYFYINYYVYQCISSTCAIPKIYQSFSMLFALFPFHPSSKPSCYKTLHGIHYICICTIPN